MGDTHYNPDTGQLETFDGENWVPVNLDDLDNNTRPENPQVGDTFLNPDTGELEIFDGENWNASEPIDPDTGESARPESGDVRTDPDGTNSNLMVKIGSVSLLRKNWQKIDASILRRCPHPRRTRTGYRPQHLVGRKASARPRSSRQPNAFYFGKYPYQPQWK